MAVIGEGWLAIITRRRATAIIAPTRVASSALLATAVIRGAFATAAITRRRTCRIGHGAVIRPGRTLGGTGRTRIR
jgi:acetyltransferase-like isoleucine patch superfamily enzyme